MKIGLLSDTHGYINDKIFQYFADCDEIWHGGDIGNYDSIKMLLDFKPIRGVFGNIDGREIRTIFPEHCYFEIESYKVLITHIGGSPPKYNADSKKLIQLYQPNLFVCGHSHILKVMTDKFNNNMLYINPGAAGRHGFHLISTIMTFEINNGKIEKLMVIEIDKKKA